MSSRSNECCVSVGLAKVRHSRNEQTDDTGKYGIGGIAGCS
jgi:hypothetical protein